MPARTVRCRIGWAHRGGNRCPDAAMGGAGQLADRTDAGDLGLVASASTARSAAGACAFWPGRFQSGGWPPVWPVWPALLVSLICRALWAFGPFRCSCRSRTVWPSFPCCRQKGCWVWSFRWPGWPAISGPRPSAGRNGCCCAVCLPRAAKPFQLLAAGISARKGNAQAGRIRNRHKAAKKKASKKQPRREPQLMGEAAEAMPRKIPPSWQSRAKEL